MRKDIALTVTAQFAKTAIFIATTLFLAKVLPPHAHGILAINFSVTVLANLLRDAGINQIIIREKFLSSRKLSVVAALNIKIALLVWLIVNILAPILAFLYHEADIWVVIFIASFSFIFGSISSIFQAVHEREGCFYIVTKIELLSNGLSAFFVVGSLFLFPSVYLAALQSTITSLLMWLLYKYFYSKAKINFAFIDIKSIRKRVLNFSALMFKNNIFSFVGRNYDAFLIPKAFSLEVAGSYAMAYKIMIFPLQNIGIAVNRVLYPFLSKSVDIESIGSKYADAFILMLIFSSPVMMYIHLERFTLVNLVLGGRWYDVSIFLQYLCFVGVIQSVTSLNGIFILTCKKESILPKVSFINMIIHLSFFTLAIKFPYYAIGLFYFAASVLVLIFTLFVLHSVVKYNISYLAMNSIYVVLCVAFSYHAVLFAEISSNGLMSIILRFFIYFGSYGTLLFLFKRDKLKIIFGR